MELKHLSGRDFLLNGKPVRSSRENNPIGNICRQLIKSGTPPDTMITVYASSGTLSFQPRKIIEWSEELLTEGDKGFVKTGYPQEKWDWTLE